MEEIMMSIRPTYAQLIDKGIKTAEVRKSIPQCGSPFRVYLYCSKGRSKWLGKIEDGETVYGVLYQGKTVIITMPEGGYGSRVHRGTVFGEFVCDNVEILNELFIDDTPISPVYHLPYNGESCLTDDDLKKYGNGKHLWSLHIRDYQYYKEPLPLAAFGLKRPPQSWCYVKGKLR